MHPILIDFPEEFFTERLYIRMPRPGDGKANYDAIEASKKELKPWLPFAQKNQSVEEVESNIREAHALFIKREDLRFLIFDKKTRNFMGSTGLHRINWDVRKFEIGYWIDTRFQGNGYITEAVQGVCDFAIRELNARRLEIRCDLENKKSRAVAERAGFTLEGVLRNECLAVDDSEKLTDTCVFAMIP